MMSSNSSIWLLLLFSARFLVWISVRSIMRIGVATLSAAGFCMMLMLSLYPIIQLLILSSYTSRTMCIALFRTDLGTGFAAYAVFRMGDGHYLFLVLGIIILIIFRYGDTFAFVIEANQLQHIAAADFKAATTTDAFFFFDVFGKLRCPDIPAG